VEFDPFWERLAACGTPFVLHVGGSPLQLAKAWANNGRAPTRDWMGGGENLRTKDVAVLHEGPETFLSMMVIDGVFERFPALRGASVELGAGWVPSLLTRLDWVARHWSRVDQNLAGFTRALKTLNYAGGTGTNGEPGLGESVLERSLGLRSRLAERMGHRRLPVAQHLFCMAVRTSTISGERLHGDSQNHPGSHCF